MKKTFVALVFALVASSAFAAPSPQSDCRVRINGTEMFFGKDGNEFFSWVYQQSSGGRCTYGKIYHMPNSGRVYANGQLVPADNGQKRGLSNEEARQAMRRAGGGCLEISCDEIGILRGNEPISNEIPTYSQPGGDW